jgi:probable rRNA maturation factor
MRVMSAKAPPATQSGADPTLPAVTVAVAAEGWRPVVADVEACAAAAAGCALACGAPYPAGGEVSVVLADDAALRTLNRDYRAIDRATNVLSFPIDAPDPTRPAWMLGEVAVALETTAREAAEEGRSVADHLTHLVVHGVLHLLGYDHIDDEDAERMETLEARLLRELGVTPLPAEQARTA